MSSLKCRDLLKLISQPLCQIGSGCRVWYLSWFIVYACVNWCQLKTEDTRCSSYSSPHQTLLFFLYIFYLYEQGDISAWLVIVAIGDFLEARQLSLHRLAVDWKTPKHIMPKQEPITEYGVCNIKVWRDLWWGLTYCLSSLRTGSVNRKKVNTLSSPFLSPSLPAGYYFKYRITDILTQTVFAFWCKSETHTKKRFRRSLTFCFLLSMSCFFCSLFYSQEWSKLHFSLQYKYDVKQTCDEKERKWSYRVRN